MKKLIGIIAVAFLLIPLHQTANAQWSIGVSYEMRDEMPDNGFGLRVEKDMLSGMPLVELALRGHWSYFNETNNVSLDGVNFSRDADAYDYGLAAVLGVKLGMIKPFAGAGIGRERFKQSVEVEGFSFKENNFYWNAFGGAEINLLPLLNPFIEYRFSRFTGTDDIDFDNVNRIAIGINLRF